MDVTLLYTLLDCVYDMIGNRKRCEGSLFTQDRPRTTNNDLYLTALCLCSCVRGERVCYCGLSKVDN